MDVEILIQSIATVGFPIVACIAMFYQNMKMIEEHKEETKNLADAINNNTLVITKLLERLNIDEGKNV